MSKRVNISLPDELVLAMKPFKEEMNVSKICAERLRQEVEALRAAQERKAEQQDAVLRLRAERLESVEAAKKTRSSLSRREGYEIGTSWVLRSASYSEIKWLTGVVAPRVEAGERPCDIVASERSELHLLMPPMESLAQLIDPREFWDGFLQAVIDMWAQIRDAVEQDEPHSPRPEKR